MCDEAEVTKLCLSMQIVGFKIKLRSQNIARKTSFQRGVATMMSPAHQDGGSSSSEEELREEEDSSPPLGQAIPGGGGGGGSKETLSADAHANANANAIAEFIANAGDSVVIGAGREGGSGGLYDRGREKSGSFSVMVEPDGPDADNSFFAPNPLDQLGPDDNINRLSRGSTDSRPAPMLSPARPVVTDNDNGNGNRNGSVNGFGNQIASANGADGSPDNNNNGSNAMKDITIESGLDGDDGGVGAAVQGALKQLEERSRRLVARAPPLWTVLQHHMPGLFMANQWSKSCLACGNTFSLGKGRHHCRFCGLLFCRGCASAKVLLPPKFMYGASPQRVCGLCVEVLQRLKEHVPFAATTPFGHNRTGSTSSLFMSNSSFFQSASSSTDASPTASGVTAPPPGSESSTAPSPAGQKPRVPSAFEVIAPADVHRSVTLMQEAQNRQRAAQQKQMRAKKRELLKFFGLPENATMVQVGTTISGMLRLCLSLEWNGNGDSCERGVE